MGEKLAPPAHTPMNATPVTAAARGSTRNVEVCSSPARKSSVTQAITAGSRQLSTSGRFVSQSKTAHRASRISAGTAPAPRWVTSQATARVSRHTITVNSAPTMGSAVVNPERWSVSARRTSPIIPAPPIISHTAPTNAPMQPTTILPLRPRLTALHAPQPSISPQKASHPCRSNPVTPSSARVIPSAYRSAIAPWDRADLMRGVMGALLSQKIVHNDRRGGACPSRANTSAHAAWSSQRTLPCHAERYRSNGRGKPLPYGYAQYCSPRDSERGRSTPGCTPAARACTPTEGAQLDREPPAGAGPAHTCTGVT